MSEQSKQEPKAWTKGGPSPNPHGRGGAFSNAVKAAAKAALGSDGVAAYGGYLSTNEPPEISGRRKWLAYAKASQFAPVAIAQLLSWSLIGGVKWTLQENDSGDPSAARGVEVVDQGLLKAKLPKPWAEIAAKADTSSWFNGNDIHAMATARRKDGVVVLTDLAHRPPHTIEQWWREGRGKQGPFVSCTQRTDDGETADLDLAECFHVVQDMLTDSPEGVGVLRFVVERLRRIDNYEKLEGAELFSGMGGTPIARVPLADINTAAPADKDKRAAFKREATDNIEGIVRDRVKTPEKRQYVVLSSETYKGENPDTISSIKKWDIEIIKAELQGLPEMRAIIRDLYLDVARVLGVEFIYVGGGDSAGTFGMHESKISLLAATFSARVERLASRATQQIARKLCVLNGLDPDVACPTLVASPVSTDDVEKTVRTLVQLGMANLPPNHPAKPMIFERLNLPYQEEKEPAAPRAPFGPGLPPMPFPPREEKKPDDGEEAAKEPVDPASAKDETPKEAA